MTNILIFGHGYAHGFIEATNQYIKLFDPAYYDVTVVYLDGEENETVRQKHVASRIIFLNTSTRQKRGLKLHTIKKMLRLHREKAFELVICHRYKPTYIMLLVSRFCRIPRLISIMHEMETLRHVSRKLFMAAFASHALLAGVSNAVRDNIQESVLRASSHDVVTLYNTIDIDQIEPALVARNEARRALTIDDSSFVFGILGRLAPAKDHETLIHAFSLVKRHCPHAKLIIMGDGEQKSVLQNQIKTLGLEKDILLPGFLEDAPLLLKALDVFVLSSIKEAFGRVLLEAMIAHLPMIATRTNGIPEVIGDAGFLVDKKNPAQLAEKMIALYHMPIAERLAWGERSYKRAVATFSMTCFQKTFWQLPLLTDLRSRNETRICNDI